MAFIIFIIFLASIISLALSKIEKGQLAKWTKLFRVVALIFSISVFTYWFIKKSAIRIIKDSVALQIINKLPQTLDFYVININESKDVHFDTKHIGKIRPDYYRIEYLKMNRSNEYWIVGYLGKKNLVYFSQHVVPNKNIDQVIEVQNYINQSVKLSNNAKERVNSYNYENVKLGIWMTLNFLLVFLNLILLLRKK